MKQETREQLDAYYKEAETWATDKIAALNTSNRRAWLIAWTAAVIALAEAIALIALLPLKTVEPYTLLVDRQTGHVEALQPLDGTAITPNEALTRSFLVQYVIARETFDIDTLQRDYQKAVLWSEGTARADYIAAMQASNTQSPLARLPRNSTVQVEINSVSILSETTAMVRYALVRRDEGQQARSMGNHVAILSWVYSGEPLTMADRLVNPLGFQVTSYRSDVESLPELRPSANEMDADLASQDDRPAADPPTGIRRIGEPAERERDERR